MDTVNIKGTHFELLTIHQHCECMRYLPEQTYCYSLPDGGVYAVKAQLGTDPHPFPELCEAAVYTDGFWVVGIDTQKNCCFTPIFA